jgi:Tfp pilus assembly PilM family ATPase
LGDFLGDWLLEQDLLHAPLVVALPPAAAHWRVIVWPFSEQPDDQIEALVTLDPSLGLPFPLVDADLDLKPLPQDVLNTGSCESLLIAAAPKLIDAWLGVFELAGVELSKLLPAQLCWMAGLQQHLRRVSPDILVVVMVPEERGARVIFWLAGKPVFERQLQGSSQNWASKISHWVALYRGHDRSVSGLALWPPTPGLHCEGIEKDLEQALGQDLDPMSIDGYGSLVLAGLGELCRPTPRPN